MCVATLVVVPHVREDGDSGRVTIPLKNVVLNGDELRIPPPLIRWVTLPKLVALAEPQFSHL